MYVYLSIGSLLKSSNEKRLSSGSDVSIGSAVSATTLSPDDATKKFARHATATVQRSYAQPDVISNQVGKNYPPSSEVSVFLR